MDRLLAQARQQVEPGRRLWLQAQEWYNRVFTRISVWVPVLLVLDIALQSYFVYDFLKDLVIDYPFPVFFLPLSALDRGLSLALLVLFSFVWLGTVGSAVWMWWESGMIFLYGYRPVPDVDVGLKMAVQAHWIPSASLLRIARGRRPKSCRLCQRRREAQRMISTLDRSHHAKAASGKDVGCLPVFDHWCPWLWVPVCLTTIKPYLLFMVYVALFHLFSAGILSWSVAIWAFGHHAYKFWIGATFLPLALNWIYAAPIIGKWKHLAFMNSTDREHDLFRLSTPSGWPMCVRASDGGYHHLMVSFNPWDLGTMGNLRSVLGESIWTWPLFWVVPRRVREYGRHPDYDCPFAPRFLDDVSVLARTPANVGLAALPARRRHMYSSES
ncbi:hypothetical protein K4K54_010125 [Colletotrichum sp. SAR 10_86]|nr:hypothetical protein K4K54_010125 [Colletotrichum sp. SAR 10_86]